MATLDGIRSSLLRHRAPAPDAATRRRIWWSSAAAIVAWGLLFFVLLRSLGGDREVRLEVTRQWWGSTGGPEVVESEVGVVAADDGRCSEIGVAALRAGGHAVDAAVAAALCLGVVHPVSSGIGGGAFIVVRSADSGEAEAFDSRETAPSAASKNMYDNSPSSKSKGALSMGIPGELAGLHKAWLKYGRLPWKALFQPSISLAKDGFLVVPFLADAIKKKEDDILADHGLQELLAPNGKILQTNDTCYNPALAYTLEVISTEGPKAFYNGSIGEKFIEDVKNAGGIATMEDLSRYAVKVSEAMVANAMGYTILGMPPPSSGTLGMSLVLNILGSYESLDAVKGLLGLHRLIEAFKHMFALRMNLGDPDFVKINQYVTDMLSPFFAKKIQQKIVDNTTFEPSYYMARWSQLRDHGTSHLCIVDTDRNAVSLTTTVNSYFGARVLSSSTGILLNNEMDDFSTPTEATPDHLPPAPANFIEPNKRPLSSMAPIIVLKDNQLAGVVGASGGLNIIPAVVQVFLNHFVLGMEPLAAVRHPRVFHKLIPNKVLYENFTAIDGEKIEFGEEAKLFLEQRGHIVSSLSSAAAVSQLVVHNLQVPILSTHRKDNRKVKNGNNIFHGKLIAISDPRKDGSPAGL
ncbi:glutathione hydrolase 3-like isoform X1 [Musa acuminata AAA Group]|uniref:glutathione hydrolase 3-like isoform X1 n=1 Tax=Musa acuminata AAA Group TaxID=214697 RepID=UPI0031D7D0F3